MNKQVSEQNDLPLTIYLEKQIAFEQTLHLLFVDLEKKL